MKNLVKDASMGPLREALKQGMEITKLNKDDMRSVTLKVDDLDALLFHMYESYICNMKFLILTLWHLNVGF